MSLIQFYITQHNFNIQKVISLETQLNYMRYRVA